MLLKSIELGELLRTRMPIRVFAESSIDKDKYIYGQQSHIRANTSTTSVWRGSVDSRLFSPGDVVMLLDKTAFTCKDRLDRTFDYILARFLFDEKVYMYPFQVNGFKINGVQTFVFENYFRIVG